MTLLFEQPCRNRRVDAAGHSDDNPMFFHDCLRRSIRSSSGGWVAKSCKNPLLVAGVEILKALNEEFSVLGSRISWRTRSVLKAAIMCVFSGQPCTAGIGAKFSSSRIGCNHDRSQYHENEVEEINEENIAHIVSA